jgi:hypothetical protein
VRRRAAKDRRREGIQRSRYPGRIEILATETVRQLELVGDIYELATLWIHQATRSMHSPRKEFSALYEYLRTIWLLEKSLVHCTNTYAAFGKTRLLIAAWKVAHGLSLWWS